MVCHHNIWLNFGSFCSDKVELHELLVGVVVCSWVRSMYRQELKCSCNLTIWDSGRYSILRLAFSKWWVSEQCQRNLLLCSSSVQTILMLNIVAPSHCLSACPFPSYQTVLFTWMVVVVSFISSKQYGLEKTVQEGWRRMEHWKITSYMGHFVWPYYSTGYKKYWWIKYIS